MTQTEIGSVERTLGRIEAQVADVRATLPQIVGKTDALTERLGAHERTTAERHRQNERRFTQLQATSDANGDKLTALDARLLKLEEPAERAAKAKREWVKRWRRRMWWCLGAVGTAGTLAEPFYRAVAEPFARAAADYLTRLFLRP